MRSHSTETGLQILLLWPQLRIYIAIATLNKIEEVGGRRNRNLSHSQLSFGKQINSPSIPIPSVAFPGAQMENDWGRFDWPNQPSLEMINDSVLHLFGVSTSPYICFQTHSIFRTYQAFKISTMKDHLKFRSSAAETQIWVRLKLLLQPKKNLCLQAINK